MTHSTPGQCMLGDGSPLLCNFSLRAPVKLSLAAAAPGGPAELSAFSVKGAVSSARCVSDRDGGDAELGVTCFVISLKA